MNEPDPVLTELDAEIRRLESVSRQVEDELRKTREMRTWWAKRHPVVVTFDQLEGAERDTPVEVVRAQPTLRELILQVLSESARPMTVAEIRDAALELGWETTSENKHPMVRNNLRRLIEEGLVEQPSKRQYVKRRPLRASWQVDDSPDGNEIPFDASSTHPGRGG